MSIDRKLEQILKDCYVNSKSVHETKGRIKSIIKSIQMGEQDKWYKAGWEDNEKESQKIMKETN